MTIEVPIRIAIIGAGIIAQSIHIPTILRAGFQLKAVCDLSPARAKEVADRYGVKAFTDPQDVLADPSIDAVLIATPGSHALLTIAALKAGKHVLAEKPLALNLGEIDLIEEAQISSGRVLQIGYMKMYDPLTAKAAKEIRKLRDITIVRVTVSHPEDAPQIEHLRMKPPIRDFDEELVKQAYEYEVEQTKIVLPDASDEYQAYFRNVIHGSIIHETSLLRGLGFDLPKVWSAEIFPKLSGNTPSSLLATGESNGIRFIISWNWLPEYPEYDEEVKVLASNGRVEFHLAKPYVLEERSRLIVQGHSGQLREDTTYTEINETGFLRQLLEFAKSIGDGTPVLANLEGVREDIRTLNALALAAQPRD
jgi:predicted dehydrogenase